MKNVDTWITSVFILVAVLIIIRAQKSGGATNIIQSIGQQYANTVDTLQGRGNAGSSSALTSLNSFTNQLFGGVNTSNTFGNSGSSTGTLSGDGTVLV